MIGEIGVVLKDVTVALSGLVVGLMLVSVYGTLRRGYMPVTKWAWALYSLGVGTRVGLLLIVVMKAPRLNTDIYTYVYVAGLALTAVGAAMLLRWRP